MKRTIMCILSLVLSLCFLVPANIITADAKEPFYSKATTALIKSHIEKDGGFSNAVTVQGACTDQKYAYFAVNNGYTTILKYDINTWKLVDKSPNTYLGHANDMTYNPKTHTIIVANNAPDYKILTFLDPDTLTVTGTKKIKQKIYSISYCESRDQYVVGLSGTYDFAILNKKFKQVKKIKRYQSGYMRQGSDCDDDYIYFVLSGGGGNLIVIYDWDGNLVDTVTLDKSLEIENIFHHDNVLFITLHHYGNFVHRIGISDDTAIKYKIKYNSNDGSGEMKNQTVTYGKYKKMRKNTFEKEGYIFGGWVMKRDSYKTYYGKKTPYSKSTWIEKDNIYEYTLFKNESRTGKTTNLGDITATAFWICENYPVYYDPNGGEGYMPYHTVGYSEEFTPSENVFTKQGYVFSGWSLSRVYDDKVYGYKKNKDEPKWLYENDVYKKHIFSGTEQLSKLTYDYGVTLTAQWESAFKFNKKGTVLEHYIGIDTDVTFPATADKLTTIGDNAFKENVTAKSVTFPSTITTIGENALTGCHNLEKVYFTDTMPKKVSNTAFESEKMKKFYLNKDEKELFLGLYTGTYSYDYLYRLYSEKLK